jgi:hypothetical protein
MFLKESSAQKLEDCVSNDILVTVGGSAEQPFGTNLLHQVCEQDLADL